MDVGRQHGDHRNNSITLAIAASPAQGPRWPARATPVTAVNGVATFAGCKITGTAGSYTLSAIGHRAHPATSNTFTVYGGAATKLAFTTQPGNGGHGNPWPRSPS